MLNFWTKKTAVGTYKNSSKLYYYRERCMLLENNIPVNLNLTSMLFHIISYLLYIANKFPPTIRNDLLVLHLAATKKIRNADQIDRHFQQLVLFGTSAHMYLLILYNKYELYVPINNMFLGFLLLLWHLKTNCHRCVYYSTYLIF